MLLPKLLSKEKQKIINRYGLDEQLLQMTEECAELIQAANKYRRKKTARDKADLKRAEEDLKLEIADVIVVIDQIMERLNMTAEDLSMMADFKIKRQLGRLSTYV